MLFEYSEMCLPSVFMITNISCKGTTRKLSHFNLERLGIKRCTYALKRCVGDELPSKGDNLLSLIKKYEWLKKVKSVYVKI